MLFVVLGSRLLPQGVECLLSLGSDNCHDPRFDGVQSVGPVQPHVTKIFSRGVCARQYIHVLVEFISIPTCEAPKYSGWLLNICFASTLGLILTAELTGVGLRMFVVDNHLI